MDADRLQAGDGVIRVDLLGPSDDEPEKIGIVFTDEGSLDVAVGDDEKTAVVEMTPNDALELAAKLSDVYALHRRWLDARERDHDAPMPTSHQMNGLTVESYRLHVLLESGYELETAERLAKDSSVDMHKAEQLAKDSGPKLAGQILT
jgi:hypothetical protein